MCVPLQQGEQILYLTPRSLTRNLRTLSCCIRPGHRGDYRSFSCLRLKFPAHAFTIARRQKLTFALDDDKIEMLVTNPGWSLEAGSNYPMTIAVGSWTQAFTMGSTGPTTLYVDIDPKTLAGMIDAMKDASRLTLKQGDANTQVVSLSGSSHAMDLFTVCAIWSETHTEFRPEEFQAFIDARTGK